MSDDLAAPLCPRCRIALVMSDRAGIEIDYCPRCRGVWLDRGELDKILERSAAYTTAERPASPAASAWTQPSSSSQGWQDRPHTHDERGKHDDRHGRRRSWLREIFD